MLTRRETLIGATALAGSHVLAIAHAPAAAAPDGAELMRELHAVLDHLRTLPGFTRTRSASPHEDLDAGSHHIPGSHQH
jgi:hypothetical protein